MKCMSQTWKCSAKIQMNIRFLHWQYMHESYSRVRSAGTAVHRNAIFRSLESTYHIAIRDICTWGLWDDMGHAVTNVKVSRYLCFHISQYIGICMMYMFFSQLRLTEKKYNCKVILSEMLKFIQKAVNRVNLLQHYIYTYVNCVESRDCD